MDVGEYTGELVNLEFKDEDPVFVRPRRIPYSLREYVHTTVLEMETKGKRRIQLPYSHDPEKRTRRPISNDHRFSRSQ